MTRFRTAVSRRTADKSVPALEALRPGPSLERIVEAVAESFPATPSLRSTGRRSDNASRVVAAFLARRRYGYRVTEVAKALGYASHGAVVTPIRRMDSAGPALRRTVQRLEKMHTND